MYETPWLTLTTSWPNTAHVDLAVFGDQRANLQCGFVR